MGKFQIDKRYQVKIQGLGYLINTEKNKIDKLVTRIGPNANYLTVFCPSSGRIGVFGGKRV